MNYLSAENLSKTYGDRTLFRNVNFGLSRGDKIDVVKASAVGGLSRDVFDSRVVLQELITATLAI